MTSNVCKVFEGMIRDTVEEFVLAEDIIEHESAWIHERSLLSDKHG